MAIENNKISKPIKAYPSDTYSPEEISIINDLLAYMANISELPASLLGDSPNIKFEPYLNCDEGS